MTQLLNNKKCDCEEKTCKANCRENHTHKGFFCPICQPERYEPATPKNSEWDGKTLLPSAPELKLANLVRRAHSSKDCPHKGDCLTEAQMIHEVGLLLRSLLQERSKDTVGSLIEKCGVAFSELVKMTHTREPQRWAANSFPCEECGITEMKSGYGFTPLEALQKLSEQIEQK